jgi:hypothetical protein
VARRILGLAHTSDEDFVAGESAFRDALTEAKEVNLDSEIGHLHRLFGWALMRLGRLDEAEQEQIEALKHEENPEFRYWKALSLAELGDVRLRKAESRGLSSFDPQSPPFDSANLPPDLTSVSKAYVDCIRSFELAVSSLVVPVARAVEQQLMRSYADNAIQIAAIRPGNLVGAIEAFGPRYANDLVSEARVAATFDASRQLDSEPGLCNFTIPCRRFYVQVDWICKHWPTSLPIPLPLLDSCFGTSLSVRKPPRSHPTFPTRSLTDNGAWADMVSVEADALAQQPGAFVTAASKPVIIECLRNEIWLQR